jgi:arylsulfatase A-like enzyme
MSTPYQWTKQVASHWGGTRNGTIVHWPKGIKAKGEIRSQFHHVIDVAPTILEAAGLPEPISVNGVHQRPIEGVSMLYSFNDAHAAERHETQYFEMFGNRGIYHKGWTAVTKHGTPWVLVAGRQCRSTTTSGNSTTPARTGARRTICPSRCRRSCMNCSGCG